MFSSNEETWMGNSGFCFWESGWLLDLNADGALGDYYIVSLARARPPFSLFFFNVFCSPPSPTLQKHHDHQHQACFHPSCPAAHHPPATSANQQSYITHPSNPLNSSMAWQRTLLQASSSSSPAAHTCTIMYARAQIIFKKHTHCTRNASTPVSTQLIIQNIIKQAHKLLLLTHTLSHRTPHSKPVNILSDMQEERHYLPSSAWSRNRMSSPAHAHKNTHTFTQTHTHTLLHTH